MAHRWGWAADQVQQPQARPLMHPVGRPYREDDWAYSPPARAEQPTTHLGALDYPPAARPAAYLAAQSSHPPAATHDGRVLQELRELREHMGVLAASIIPRHLPASPDDPLVRYRDQPQPPVFVINMPNQPGRGRPRENPDYDYGDSPSLICGR